MLRNHNVHRSLHCGIIEESKPKLIETNKTNLYGSTIDGWWWLVMATGRKQRSRGGNGGGGGGGGGGG